MKLKKIIILFILFVLCVNISFATEEIYSEVSKGFGISDFTKEAKKYTQDNFPDFDLDLFIKNSITGKSEVGFLKSTIIKIFGDEISARNKAYD